MPELLGWAVGTPWIYGLITLSVLLDVFLPVLPSGVLVIAAAAAVAGTTAAEAAQSGTHFVEMLGLVSCTALASFLGDLAVYQLAWRGGPRLRRAIARSRRLTSAHDRLGHALVRGGGTLVVLARFAPAGRSVVSLTAGAAHRRAKDFVPWSALAGVCWAAYTVSLGYLGSQWLDTAWVGTAVSLLALFAAGWFAAYFIRRRPVAATAPGDTP
ncbi:DedA family protein [Streptomyces oceani]|uniref:VTT domain-containing protein n=1 Tax=Streptomyces oceani TaxID=1075402 RepID=A0A1E7KF87_9ACTN|nr:VTT domain-containing protein [Streptomyces oceani]OEV02590.1 hypothetical protein AN216_13770 [Streptomyces oceani]